MLETKRDVLAAVNRNFYLRDFSFSYEGEEFLNNAEDEIISSLFTRNLRLATWLRNPTSVPKHLWPELLQMAIKAGREILYLSLRAIAPDIESSHRPKKRKRES